VSRAAESSPGSAPRAAARLFCGLILSAGLLGCGTTTIAPPAWVATHSDTSVLSFQTSAPGVCAITVRYPDDAPSAIGYLGSTYVQVSRRPHPSVPGGRDLGRSGDWHVFLESGGDLLLVTPGDAFGYRQEATC
jgi:hypothetical protein